MHFKFSEFHSRVYTRLQFKLISVNKCFHSSKPRELGKTFNNIIRKTTINYKEKKMRVLYKSLTHLINPCLIFFSDWQLLQHRGTLICLPVSSH